MDTDCALAQGAARVTSAVNHRHAEPKRDWRVRLAIIRKGFISRQDLQGMCGSSARGMHGRHGFRGPRDCEELSSPHFSLTAFPTVERKMCGRHGDLGVETSPPFDGGANPKGRKALRGWMQETVERHEFWAPGMDHYVERLVDLTEPEANQILNLTVDEARARLPCPEPIWSRMSSALPHWRRPIPSFHSSIASAARTWPPALNLQ